MRGEAERDGDKETNEKLPKAKMRKYDDAYRSAWLHCDYGGRRGKTGVLTVSKNVGSGQHEAK